MYFFVHEIILECFCICSAAGALRYTTHIEIAVINNLGQYGSVFPAVFNKRK